MTMTKTPATRVRAVNLYTVEQDGQPVAQAMAISQAEAVRLYVESVQQPTMSARLSSPLEARTLAHLPTGERKDEPLVCDVCGAECADPWHYSSGERRHMHACDACWPGVRKQGGGRQAVLLTDEQILEVRKVTKPLPQQWGETLALSRAIEAAVIAANGLEVRRG
jgi:hypothetical protein